MGESKEGFEKALIEALEQAKKTIRNVRRIKVLSMSATVKWEDRPLQDKSKGHI